MHLNKVLTSLAGKFFSPLKEINFTDKNIILNYKNGHSKDIKYSEVIDFPTVKYSLFGASLNFRTTSQEFQYSMLNKQATMKLQALLDAVLAQALSRKIQNCEDYYTRYAVKEYLRDSSVPHLDHFCRNLMQNYQASYEIWQTKLNNQPLSSLDFLAKRYPFDHYKQDIRKEFEQLTFQGRKDFYDRIESNPLTQQQRLAVIRNNDLNLVLAAAGTGKTSVMVAKALDLIDSGMVKSEEILVLAYNKAAAKELMERLNKRSELAGVVLENTPTISTFHSLGRKVLKDSNIDTKLSVFVEDNKKLEIWISDWLKNYITQSPLAVFNFFELQYQAVNQFDFKTKQEYDAYVRDNEYRTLNGEQVRGYQELIIANWLFLNGVAYEYETPYKTKRRIEDRWDYRPDFYLTDTNIYLEHFGIDRQARTRADIDAVKYNDEMKSKRVLHQEYGTVLIETYHYDWTENNLENRLAILMAENGIQLQPKKPEEIFEVLNSLGMVEETAKKYLKCLQAIRVERLTRNGVLKRLQEHSIFYSVKYTELLDKLHTDYKAALSEESAIDFDDMIIQSTALIEKKVFQPTWKYILIDEFQDISLARMQLIQALITYGPNPILTVVGDDWQSIYRFSGGKLELTTRFETLVGSHSLTMLEKTYRYNNSIADVAGQFVMQNPEQYKKQVQTQSKVDSSQVFLLDSPSDKLDHKIEQVIKTIRKNDPVGSIAVLARYNYLLKDAKAHLKSKAMDIAKIKFWTFHGSKGLEADYCILVGFFQGKTGFPNQNKQDALVEALLPSLDHYPNSEERRLLYVAITRAKKKCYLIADASEPSDFISELLSPKYNVYIASERFKEKYQNIFKCSICSTGYYKLITGQHGEFYACSSGSMVCKVKPRTCEKCGSPSVDHRGKSICNNALCKHQMILCEKCGRPMKLREGKFGKFWGCTGYANRDDQCKYKRQYFV